MKNLTTAIYSKLSGSTLTSLIGGRLYKGRAPENVQYPYAVFFVVVDTQADTFKDKHDDVIIQFSLFSSASSTTEIEGIYAALKSLYDDATLSITGATQALIHRISATFMSEEHTTRDGLQEIWHYSVDYHIVQQRTA